MRKIDNSLELKEIEIKEENKNRLYFFEAKSIDSFKKSMMIFLNLGYHYSEKIEDELWEKNGEYTYITGIEEEGSKYIELGSIKSHFFLKEVLLQKEKYQRLDFHNYIGKFGITIDDCNNIDIIDIKKEYQRIKDFEAKNDLELENRRKDLDEAYDHLETFIKYGKKEMAVKTRDYIKIITEKMIDIKLREI